jgi:hypothetical protein
MLSIALFIAPYPDYHFSLPNYWHCAYFKILHCKTLFLLKYLKAGVNLFMSSRF